MANLCAGICSSLLGRERLRIPRGSPGIVSAPCPVWGGSIPVALVAALLWNQRQDSPGIGGRLAMESVAGFAWNRWQLWRGIRRQAAQHAHVSKSYLSKLIRTGK